MPIERTNLWTDVFRATSTRALVPERRDAEAGAARVQRLGTRAAARAGSARARSRRCATTSRRCRRRCREPYRVRARRARRREAGEPEGRDLAAAPYRLGDEVPRGFLTVLGTDEPRRSRRAAAGSSWPTRSSQQPIAMRVIVNRIWKGHFGTGLVDTPSNFGVNGERPSHPELLDYLAQFFVDHGHVDQGAASRDHAERRRISSAPRTPIRPRSTRTRATGSTGARIARG